MPHLDDEYSEGCIGQFRLSVGERGLCHSQLEVEAACDGGGSPSEATWVRSNVSCSAAPRTCTVKLADAELPCVSVAVQPTVVVPIGNVFPKQGCSSAR